VILLTEIVFALALAAVLLDERLRRVRSGAAF